MIQDQKLISTVHGCNGTARVYQDVDAYLVAFRFPAEQSPTVFHIADEVDAIGRARVLACHDMEDL